MAAHPVVLVTGNTSSLTRERILEAGVREVLPKPYTIDSLAAVIHRHLVSRPIE